MKADGGKCRFAHRLQLPAKGCEGCKDRVFQSNNAAQGVVGLYNKGDSSLQYRREFVKTGTGMPEGVPSALSCKYDYSVWIGRALVQDRQMFQKEGMRLCRTSAST